MVLTNIPVSLEPTNIMTYDDTKDLISTSTKICLSVQPTHTDNMTVNDCLIGLYLSGYKWVDDSQSKILVSDLSNPLAILTTGLLTIRFLKELKDYSAEEIADILKCLLCLSTGFQVYFDNKFTSIRQAVQSLSKAIDLNLVKSDYLERINRDFKVVENPFAKR